VLKIPHKKCTAVLGGLSITPAVICQCGINSNFIEDISSDYQKNTGEIERNNKPSKDFEVFHQYVFGNYQSFYHNGLDGDTCTNLKGAERKTAEQLVLEALANSNDSRLIIAVGHFGLQSAIPLLEHLLFSDDVELYNEVRVIVWALVRIQKDKKYLTSLVDIVTNKPSDIKGLARKDATSLLSEFGKNTTAVNTLLIALTDEEISVRQSARFALENVFAGNALILELLDHVKFFKSSHDERMEISKKIKDILNN
jgi:hypothetical protein